MRIEPDRSEIKFVVKLRNDEAWVLREQITDLQNGEEELEDTNVVTELLDDVLVQLRRQLD
jgi:hypothetical protein